VDGVNLIANTLRGEGFDASEDGTGRGVPLVPEWPAEIASTLDAHYGDKMGLENQHVNSGCPLFVPFKPPMLVRMREGKEGGGKGPLVSEDQSLTLATRNDQVLCTHEIVGSLCAESGPNTHGSRGVSGTQTMLQGYIQPTQSMQVRRLTPVECERLQGFPIVRQMLYIAACLDPASGSVDVALRCHRLQSSVWPADANELMQFAATAEEHSNTPQASQEPLVLARVLMHSEAKVQEFRSAGKLIWSARSADEQSECHQLTRVETIAHALARHGHVVAKEIMDGKEASPQNTSGSSHRKNGEVCVTLSIAGTKANAGDATNDHRGDGPQFTTSELGQVIPKEDSTLATALCSVLHAIAGSIPEQTLPENFSIAIEVGRGYTNIPWRGKPESPDGPRYKSLGNSWAVPCARWIGERIKAIRP
jgi:site-specific DNA-cytosine methylase